MALHAAVVASAAAALRPRIDQPSIDSQAQQCVRRKRLSWVVYLPSVYPLYIYYEILCTRANTSAFAVGRVIKASVVSSTISEAIAYCCNPAGKLWIF